MVSKKAIRYVVINDFRALPFSSAIHIYNNNEKNNHVTKFIVSERFIDSEDYGAHIPSIYKLIKYWWIKTIYNVVIIKGDTNTQLTISEKGGVTSSLQSITSDSSASVCNYPRLYKQLEQSSLGAKEIKEFILNSGEMVDKVYIFNGRTAASYPIARGCFDKGIALEFYEYPQGLHGYKLFPCAPHNTTYLGKAVSDFRKVCIISAPELLKRANAWKLARLTNPHTKRYRNPPEKKFDVVVFLGSSHEYTCLDEDISGYRFIGNFNLVKSVIKKYKDNSSIAVRAHPNQSSDRSNHIILKEIRDICLEAGVVFYEPSSDVSSYDLIKHSEITAVEFSSIAYDAILMGKNVDLFNDLDLKMFLNDLSSKEHEDKDFVSSRVCELMCLYDDLYLERFDMVTASMCKFWTMVEWKLLKSHTPKILS